MGKQLKRLDRNTEEELTNYLDSIEKNDKRNKTLDKRLTDEFAGIKTEKENKMKNVNFKKLLETVKTIAIVALIAGIIGFAIGVKYQESKSEQFSQRVAEQVKQLKQ